MSLLKIKKTKDGLSVTLPEHMLEQMCLLEGSTVLASVVDGAIVLRPLSMRSERVMGRVKALMKQHRTSLGELNDN